MSMPDVPVASTLDVKISDSTKRGERLRKQEEGPRNSLDDESDHLDNTPTVSSTLSARLGRPHPWDFNIPVRMGKVETRETSMEMAAGVEARFSPKYNAGPDTCDVVSSRDMRKQRLGRETESTKAPRNASIEKLGSHHSGELAGDSFQVDPKLLDNGGWKVDRNDVQSKHENAMAMSDNFDSAWVSLPTSSFFPKQPANSRRQVDTQSNSRNQSRSRTYRQHVDSISEQLFAPIAIRREATVQSFSPQAKHYTTSRSYVATREAPRKDGNLSVYDQNTIGTATSTDSPESGVETPLTSASLQPRRGMRGLLNRRGNASREGIVDQTSVSSSSNGIKSHTTVDTMEEAKRERGRVLSEAPMRERARSLEERRVRNPSIARKFSRLLRVYDNEKAHF
jgi:hypothetical protein